MLTEQALEIVLNMAKLTSNRGSADFTDLEKEAIEEVELLLRSFDDDFWDKHDTTSENGGC